MWGIVWIVAGSIFLVTYFIPPKKKSNLFLAGLFIAGGILWLV